MEMNQILPQLMGWLAIYGIKALAAIVIFVAGRWIARALTASTRRVMKSREVDPALISFAGSLIYFGLLAVVIIAALAQLGIQTTSFIAIIGAAGLAIGLALQDSLGNFASGVLLIIFRPFKAGDYIEAGGVAGTVEEIQIFTTTLKSPDNRAIIIPNGKIYGDNIVNYSAKKMRRIDLTVGVGYSDDLGAVKRTLEAVLERQEGILEDPPPVIAVSELADSSVNLVVRPWVKTEDYWAVYFDLTEKIKLRFDAEGISIPFPQRDVHMHRAEAV